MDGTINNSRKLYLQMFLDDVGVTVAMISVTLLAVLVVILKVVVFSDVVSMKVFLLKYGSLSYTRLIQMCLPLRHWNSKSNQTSNTLAMDLFHVKGKEEDNFMKLILNNFLSVDRYLPCNVEYSGG